MLTFGDNYLYSLKYLYVISHICSLEQPHQAIGVNSLNLVKRKARFRGRLVHGLYEANSGKAEGGNWAVNRKPGVWMVGAQSGAVLGKHSGII